MPDEFDLISIEWNPEQDGDRSEEARALVAPFAVEPMTTTDPSRSRLWRSIRSEASRAATAALKSAGFEVYRMMYEPTRPAHAFDAAWSAASRSFDAFEDAVEATEGDQIKAWGRAHIGTVRSMLAALEQAEADGIDLGTPPASLVCSSFEPL